MTRKHSATVRIIKGGRITIPSDIREIEDINEGDYVKITVEKIEIPSNRKQSQKKTEILKQVIRNA